MDPSKVSSSPSTLPRSWTYDVFLSFRGQDTRKSFTDHLYSSLVQKEIKTFRDDERLTRRGEDISLKILKALEESKIAIIIFSQNYASSVWCLDELVQILRCRETKQQRAVPIFYKVDPSEIRNQTGRIGEALVFHEQRLDKDEKVIRLGKPNSLSLFSLPEPHTQPDLRQSRSPPSGNQKRRHQSHSVHSDLLSIPGVAPLVVVPPGHRHEMEELLQSCRRSSSSGHQSRRHRSCSTHTDVLFNSIRARLCHRSELPFAAVTRGNNRLKFEPVLVLGAFSGRFRQNLQLVVVCGAHSPPPVVERGSTSGKCESFWVAVLTSCCSFELGGSLDRLLSVRRPWEVSEEGLPSFGQPLG
ncbi:hypothetical protein ACLB2K_012896 [Fragaria x ananassa]